VQARRVAAAGVSQVFAAVNYHGVLARGYALALDAGGALLGSADAAKAAGAFTLRFGDGDVGVTALEAGPNPAKATRKPTRKSRESEPTLF